MRAAAELPAGIYSCNARESSYTALHKRRLDMHMLLLLPGLLNKNMASRDMDERTQQPGLTAQHSWGLAPVMCQKVGSVSPVWGTASCN